MSTRVVSWAARAVAVLCVFAVGVLGGCSRSSGNAAKKKAAAPRSADFAPPPAPDLPGEPTYADEAAADPRTDFLFSGSNGRRARGVPSRRDEPAPREPSRRTARDVGGPDDGRPGPALEPRPDRKAKPKTPRRAERRGNAILVVWEALAREKQLLEDSRFKRRGPQPPQKITLVNSSHPDAHKFTSGRARAEGGHTAVLSDGDMQAFLKGMERSGFYRYARSIGNESASLSSENARGRVTISRNGSSRTLISMRGQGQNAATRNIPRIYSETKQAIMVLKNMSPTLNVSHVGTDPLRPR